MARVVSLFLPSWSTDRLRRTLGAAAPPVEAPLVLTGRDGRRRVVLALDAAARRVGLRVGMPAANARALVPGLIFRDAEPPADAKALDRLALWALQPHFLNWRGERDKKPIKSMGASKRSSLQGGGRRVSDLSGSRDLRRLLQRQGEIELLG